MRKVILIPLLIFAINGYAQLGISGGAIGNYIVTPVPSQFINDFSPRISFVVNPYYNFKLSEFSFFRLGMIYSRKGGYQNVPKSDANGNPAGDYRRPYKIDYLELPISLVLGDDFHGLIGISPSYNISAKIIYHPGLIYDIGATFRIFDFGIHGGLGGYIKISERYKLNIEGILSYGLIQYGYGNNLSIYLMIGIQKVKEKKLND